LTGLFEAQMDKIVAPFLPLRVYLLVFAFLPLSVGCSYKPAYLKASEPTPVSERWKVKAIDPAKLSPEETAIYEKMGAPQFVRFYRTLSPDRQRVYLWIYTDPVRLIYFLERKQWEYIVLDENPSPWNEGQKKIFFWSGITAGSAAGLGAIYYYLLGRK